MFAGIFVNHTVGNESAMSEGVFLVKVIVLRHIKSLSDGAA